MIFVFFSWILKNDTNRKEVKVKAIFDSGAQRSYLSDRIRKFLDLIPECEEMVTISTFGNTKPLDKVVEKVCVKILGKNEHIMKALCVPIICLPLTNQPINEVKSMAEFDGLNFADSGDGNEIHLLIGSDYYWQYNNNNNEWVSECICQK